MSFFRELLKWLPFQPEVQDRDTCHSIRLPHSSEPPSTPSKPVLSPSNPPSSSPTPPILGRQPQSSSLHTSSSSPKFATSSSKLPPSPFVSPSSSSLQPPTPSSTSSPFSPHLSTYSSKPLQASLSPASSEPHSLSTKPPTSSSKPSEPPSTPSKPVLSPSNPPLSSPTPPTLGRQPQSSSLHTSSSSPKFATSSSSPKFATSSSKLPPSPFVSPSSSSLQPPTPSSTSSPFSPHLSTYSSKPLQASLSPASYEPHSLSTKPPTSSSKPSPSSSNQQSSSISTSSPSPKFPTSLSRTQPSSSSKLPQSTFVNSSSSKLSTSSSKPPQASSKSHSSSPNPPTSPKPSPSSGPPVPSTEFPPIFKQVLSPASSNVINEKGEKNYVCVDIVPIFTIPEDIKDLIKNDIVPKVLKQPLSPTTYKDYFAALLYAEEFYHEKWADFNMKNVTLKLHEAAVYKNKDKEEKTFVEFEIDSVPENRPFLLSRDLVHVRPSGTNAEQFQGIIHRIIRSNLVLVEFEDEFYDYHYSTQKYDVSFSFNRVCLKRAHQAVQTASDTLFQNFLFPDCVSRTSIPTAPALLSGRHKLDAKQLSAVRQILSIQGSPPYLVAGQLGVEMNVFRPSRTGAVVCEAVHQLCQTSLKNRILICSPSNRCCDGIMSSLLKVIPESDMFRANAAFREKDEVPDDILSSCLYEDPYFSCPPTEKLKKFRVIFSTLMSSFRLHDKGLTSGHFSHIFLVDASSAIEPETAVALTNFAEKSTTVIVTGQPGDNSRWVRADMARQKGLKISYFERLFKSMPYRSLNPMLITQLDQ